MVKPLPTEIPPSARASISARALADEITEVLSIKDACIAASQRMLAQAQHENRVRGECLAAAMGALEYIKDELPGTIETAISALDDIETRLAQLEPEEGAG